MAAPRVTTYDRPFGAVLEIVVVAGGGGSRIDREEEGSPADDVDLANEDMMCRRLLICLLVNV